MTTGMIVLFILAYLIVGFVVGMVFAFIDKRTGTWVNGDSECFCAICIIGWPPILAIAIVIGIGMGLATFYNWFASCINEKEA